MTTIPIFVLNFTIWLSYPPYLDPRLSYVWFYWLRNTCFIMGVSTVQWRLTIGCFNPRPRKNFRKSPRSHVYPNTGRNFITPLHNVSLCLLTIFVVFFTISGVKILASNKAATRLLMAPIRTQFLYKPSLLIFII